MRMPTPQDALLAWWRAAVSDHRHGRQEDEPQAGFYFMKRVKGGPAVPVRIWCRQIIDADTGELAEPEVMMADVGGEDRPASEVWMRVRPIPQRAYQALAHLCAHPASTLSMQATHAKLDLAKTPIFPPKRTTA
jgi:hypothetical protein